MPRAVIYCRVSTDEQVGSGAGLDAQLDTCHAWADREGYDAVGPFVEIEGVSGSTPLDKRTALLDAIAELGRDDVLLAAKTDRLARGEPFLTATIESAIRRKKARFVSAAGEGTAGDDPASVLQRRIMTAFAEYELLLIRARTKAALAAKKRRGERTGRIPFGMEVVDDGRRSKTGNLPVRLAVDPAERRLLDAILGLRRGGWNYRRIAWALNRQGARTRDGKPWQHTSIRWLCTEHLGPTHATRSGNLTADADDDQVVAEALNPCRPAP